MYLTGCLTPGLALPATSPSSALSPPVPGCSPTQCSRTLEAGERRRSRGDLHGRSCCQSRDMYVLHVCCLWACAGPGDGRMKGRHRDGQAQGLRGAGVRVQISALVLMATRGGPFSDLYSLYL